MLRVLLILRLVALMLLGAFVGFGFLSYELLKSMYGYDHGFGEGAKATIVATVLGALAGLAGELFLRARENRRR
jgi:hypothetical protein